MAHRNRKEVRDTWDPIFLPGPLTCNTVGFMGSGWDGSQAARPPRAVRIQDQNWLAVGHWFQMLTPLPSRKSFLSASRQKRPTGRKMGYE